MTEESVYNKLIEKSIAATKKELEKENTKLNKIYDFLENGIYSKEEFIERSKAIKDNIQNLESKIKEYNSLLQKNDEIQTQKETIIPKLEISKSPNPDVTSPLK